MTHPIEVRETSSNRVNVYKLVEPEQRFIQDISSSLPQIRLEDDALAPDILTQYRTAFFHPTLEHLRAAMKQSLETSFLSKGYILIRGLPVHMNEDSETDLNILTALSSLVAIPIKVYQRWPLYKPLGVNPDIDPMRATGTGINPLHVDMVNTTDPPYFVSFIGVRADPAGGGYSLVSHFPRAISQLTEQEILQLQHPVFREGLFYDLSQVGEEYKPFPVLQKIGDLWGVRYTGKGIEIDESSEGAKEALERLGTILDANTERFLLGPNDVAIFNQRIAAHGREALGERWGDYPPHEQRLIKQLFLKADFGGQTIIS